MSRFQHIQPALIQAAAFESLSVTIPGPAVEDSFKDSFKDPVESSEVKGSRADDEDGIQHIGHRDIDTVVERAKPQLKAPPMYKVLLLNDDYTPHGVCYRGVADLFCDEPREGHADYADSPYSRQGNLWDLYP